MKSRRRISQLAAEDACPELVLELLIRLCTEEGLSTNRIVSPTAPPELSTSWTGGYQGGVDKSGVPTTTVGDIDTDDDGSGAGDG